MEREDIQVLQLLGTDDRIGKLSFQKLIALLTGFCEEIVWGRYAQPLALDQQTISTAKLFVNRARQLATGDHAKDEWETCRVQAWDWHDRSAGSQQHLARVIVCCLYDEETAEFDTYGSEAILETALSFLLDLGEGYCFSFLNYAKVYLDRELKTI